jgi:nucleoside-diphosphate-sugar epimerase
MRLLVTGATGFIGKHLVCHFNGLGWTVIRGLRSRGNDSRAENVHPDIVRVDPDTGHFDISDRIDGVVHLAGIAHATGVDAEEYRSANAVWTQKIGRRAAELGIPRLIFISTAKVTGDSHPVPIDERAPFHPNDIYASSKAAAEVMLDEVGRQNEMRIITIRLPLVYGPGVKANFLSLLKLVDSGWPLPLASVINRRSLVYVGNLASAIEVCLTRPVAANRTFFVSDDYDVSIPQLVEAIATALGKRPRLFPFPPRLLQVLGGLAGRKDQVARLTESLQVDISRIKTEINWQPPFSLQQGLAHTASWYRTRSGN